MKLVLLIALLPLAAHAQKSVCLNETPRGVLLNICRHERGMAPMPQPKLYLRIYKDGRAEYEYTKPGACSLRTSSGLVTRISTRSRVWLLLRIFEKLSSGIPFIDAVWIRRAR